MRLIQANYRAGSLPLWSRKETQQKGDMNGGVGTTAWKEIFSSENIILLNYYISFIWKSTQLWQWVLPWFIWGELSSRNLFLVWWFVQPVSNQFIACSCVAVPWCFWPSKAVSNFLKEHWNFSQKRCHSPYIWYSKVSWECTSFPRWGGRKVEGSIIKCEYI